MSDYMVHSNFGEIFSVSSGVGLPQHKMKYGIYPVYGGNGITGFHSDFIFEEKRLIIGRVGEHCGNIHITSKKAWITDNALIVYFKDNSEVIEFWYYFLCYCDLRNIAFKGAQPVITGGIIKRSNILYVRKKEKQRKIAKILTTVDNLIEKTQTLIDKYQSIKQGMMHDLFTRGVDENGKLRPTYKEAPHLYKESELGWIPKGWDCGTIDDFCEIHNYLRKPISEEEREKIKGDYPYYGCTGVLGYINEFRVDGQYVLIGEDGDHFLKFNTQNQTLLLDGKYNVNNHAHILKGKLDCMTEWIHTFFVLRDITFYLTRQGAGRFKLNKATLISILMLKPPKPEQEHIFKRFQSVEGRIHTEQESLSKLKEIKSGLMQDLLTGKVRVKFDEIYEEEAS